MIYVVNKKVHVPTDRDVYIGRPSCLGNPFSHLSSGTLAKYKVGSREAAVAHYKTWLLHQLDIKAHPVWDEFYRIVEMACDGDVYLVCWCAPLACHGDVIKELINQS